MSSKIFIYGVPGSGKTYISQNMSKDLNLSLFEADTLKDELREKTTKELSPFLFLGTCQAYRHFGELNSENAIKGLRAVRQALADTVNKEIDDHSKLIMEGAFLDPNLLEDKGKMILVITTNEDQHKSQFFEHRKNEDTNIEEFKSTRIIQEFLISEANDLEIEIMENNK